jgi:hypothetical protein
MKTFVKESVLRSYVSRLNGLSIFFDIDMVYIGELFKGFQPVIRTADRKVLRKGVIGKFEETMKASCEDERRFTKTPELFQKEILNESV